MASYTPPGVSFKDSTVSSFTSGFVTPSSVGIFGKAISTKNVSERLTLPADDGGQPVKVVIPHPNVSDLVVKIAATGDQLALTTDYVVTETGGYSKLKRATGSSRLNGTKAVELDLSYSYKAEEFDKALRFSSVRDVYAMYGNPFSEDGDLVSPLSLAASLAMQNGASSVICVACENDTTSDLTKALETLNLQKDVAVVNMASGVEEMFPVIASAIDNASASELERRAVIGIDGSTSAKDASYMLQKAGRLKNRRIALIAPSVVNYRIPDSNRLVRVGGQFLAAAVAGRAVSIPVQLPLTRKQVNGFDGFTDNSDAATKNMLSAGGCMVVEQTVQGGIRIRHGVSTDTTSKNTTEWSVTGCTDYLIAGLRTILDESDFIGSPVTNMTIPSIKGMIDAFLKSSVAEDVIGGFNDLLVRQRASEPDVIDVSFSIDFLFPLNRIYVTMTSSSVTGQTNASVN